MGRSLLGTLTGIDQAAAIARLAAGLTTAAILVGVLAWGAAGHGDARALEREAELLCSAGGSAFAASPARPGAKPRKADRGKACLSRIRELAKFKTDALSASNQVLAEATGEQAEKTRKDTARAVADAAERKAAVQQMETRDAEVADDQVGGDWFADLNRLGGLRTPGG